VKISFSKRFKKISVADQNSTC